MERTELCYARLEDVKMCNVHRVSWHDRTFMYFVLDVFKYGLGYINNS